MVTPDSQILDRRLYTYLDVDRILGLTGGTAKRWINGYERASVQYPPVVREETLETDTVTWGEFIEVYYLSRFRNVGIPLQKLRRTLMSIRDRRSTHYLFAHDDVLYAEPHELEVIGRVQEEEGIPFLVVKRTGQVRFELEPDARTRLERITFAEGVAQSLRPRMDMDHVVVAADRFFGKPKIAETGISPVAVAQLVRSGTPIETVAEFYDLKTSVIDEAGRFSYGSRWALAA